MSAIIARTVNSASELRLYTPAQTSEVYEMKGFTTPGDGGGGLFRWDAASTASDDGSNIFAVAGVATGRWIRITGHIQRVPTLAVLRTLTPPGNGATVWVERHGAIAEDPGQERYVGGGMFKYDTSYTTSTFGAPFTTVFASGDDDGAIIKPATVDAGSAGRWVRVAAAEGHTNVAWYGACGLGTTGRTWDDIEPIQRAIFSANGRYLSQSQKGVVFPSGEYYVSKAIIVPYYTEVRGENFPSIIGPVGGTLMQVGLDGVKIRDFRFYGGKHHVKLYGDTWYTAVDYYHYLNPTYTGNVTAVISGCHFIGASGPAIYQDFNSTYPAYNRSFWAPLMVEGFYANTASLYWGFGDDVRFHHGEINHNPMYGSLKYKDCILSDGYVAGCINGPGVLEVSNMRIQCNEATPTVTRKNATTNGNASGEITVSDATNFLQYARVVVDSSTQPPIHAIIRSKVGNVLTLEHPDTHALLDLSGYLTADTAFVKLVRMTFLLAPHDGAGNVRMSHIFAGDATQVCLFRQRAGTLYGIAMPHDAGDISLDLDDVASGWGIDGYWYECHSVLPGRISVDEHLTYSTYGNSWGVWLASTIDLAAEVYDRDPARFSGATDPGLGFIFRGTGHTVDTFRFCQSTLADNESQMPTSFVDVTRWFVPFYRISPFDESLTKTYISHNQNNLFSPGVIDGHDMPYRSFSSAAEIWVDDTLLGRPIGGWTILAQNAWFSVYSADWGVGLPSGVYTFSFYTRVSKPVSFRLGVQFASPRGGTTYSTLGSRLIDPYTGYQRIAFSFYWPGGATPWRLGIFAYNLELNTDLYLGLFAVHKGHFPAPYTAPVDNAASPTTQITLPRVFGEYRNTAAPTAGTYVAGDVVWNATPTSGAPLGWVCVSSGTPGTWLHFGALGDFASVVVTSASQSVTAGVNTDVLCNRNGTVTVTLPASPTHRQCVRVKDAYGGAAANNITVNANGKTIDGYDYTVISGNYQAITLVYDSTLGRWVAI